MIAASPAEDTHDAARSLAQLRAALAAVERMAGRPAADATDDPIDAAYANASPVARRRFNRSLRQAAAWAASGVEALIAAAQGGRPVEAAAGRLADELERAIEDAVAALEPRVPR